MRGIPPILMLIWSAAAGVASGAITASNASIVSAPFAEFVGRRVAVEFASGRVIVGTLDEQSDDQMLWLRRSTERVTLSSGFPTTRIVRCQITELDNASGNSDAILDNSPRRDDCLSPDCAGVEDDSYNDVGKVAAIEIIAEVANFDDDVEADGLRVWVRPVDRFGHTVAVAGRLQFKLLGERRDWRGGRHDLRGPTFLELEQWSARLQQDELSQDGALINLEFRNFHPDRELDVANDALLYVRLSVPGRGVFAASDDRLFLRPWSQIRDDLQQGSDSRFFPQERSWIRSQR